MTVPERWRERAQYDIETARVMLDAGRFLYVPFCCQQAVEKSLKAIIVEKTKKLPPRLHNLVALTENAGLTADGEQHKLMRFLTEFYVDSRYPEIRGGRPTEIDRGAAERCLKNTLELMQWLTTLRKT